MATVKEYKLAEKRVAEQRQIIGELSSLVGDIERCVKTIDDLQTELAAAVEKHKGPRTTREEIAYLEDLLRCANRKLIWEKHMASLKKRTRAILERMGQLINDPSLPADDPIRPEMLRALQAVQAAMQKLQDQTGGLQADENPEAK
jgi:hypothetical protein